MGKGKKTYYLWGLAIPIAFESFFQMLFGFADTYVLSQYADQAVAAAGYVNQFLSIVLLLFRVVASGTSILLAQSIGAQDDKKQREICRAGFWMSVVLGVGSFLMIFGFKGQIIRLLGMDRSLWEQGEAYLEIMSLGLFFQSVFAVFTSFFRSYGKAVYTSAASVMANILNVVGDLLVVSGYLHIFGTVKDVALVTAAANAAAATVIFAVLVRKDRGRMLQKPETEALKEIVKLGIPAAGESCSYKCSQMAVTMMIGFLGTEALTAKIYAMNFSYMLVLLPNSIAIAAGIMVGVHAGAHRLDEARHTSFVCIRKGAAAITALDLIILIWGHQFLGIFTNNQDMIRLAYMVLLLDMVTMFAKNCNLTFGNSLRAVGDVRYPVEISVLSMWGIGTGMAWVFGIFLGWGLPGIFAAFLLDEVLRSFLLWRRWMKKSAA